MNEARQLEVAVFEAALQLPADQRAPYLEQACGADADLRRRVEDLLGAFQRAGGFMSQSAVPEPTVAFRLPPTEKPGDTIGRYKLLEQIGEGGCGVVYMAEQQEPVRRRVALKVIKLGMDTKSVIARFEAERQALAMMDHPNIAKVHDAGATETGRPYFVMELVHGIRITDYCDQNNLPTVERLKLFTQICQAIQHAHQKGVIHRDIKPSNILVTLHDGVPVPKVIDFGIAKATTDQRLTDKTLFTHFEQFIGTPAYMSPEQAERSGLDIDTRSDIYGLGVLLYELLTGTTPFDAKELLAVGLDEMRRTIREVEPPKPSTRLTQELAASSATVASATLASAVPADIPADRARSLRQRTLQVRGDLDWIVMKCLEKERTRRYETANGLATDVQRYLNNEPVVARPPSTLYRFQKSLQRNKLAFGAATAVALALVIGFAVSTAMYFKAQAERKNAQTEAAKSQQVAQFLKDMLKGVGPSVALGRDTKMLREIVDKTADRIGTDFKKQPEVEIELRLTLGSVYLDLQEFRKMEQTANETVRVARAHFGEENLAVADALSQVADALRHLRVLDDAEISARRAIAICRKFRGEDSVQEGSTLETLGDILRLQAIYSQTANVKDKLTEAEASVLASLEIFRHRLGNNCQETASALQSLNLVLECEGKHEEAEKAIRESIAILQGLFGEEHPLTALTYNCLGHTLTIGSTDRLAEAEAWTRKALEVQKRTEGDGMPLQMWTHSQLGRILEKQGKLGEAEVNYREAVAIAKKVTNTDYPELPRFLSELAGLLRKERHLVEARSLAEESVAICQRLSGRVERQVQNRAFAGLRNVLSDLGDTNALEKLELTNRQMEAKSERR